MNEMHVRGRGFTSPAAHMIVKDDCVIVRIDDDDNPEFWLELTLPRTVTTANGQTLRVTYAVPDGGAK